MDDAKASAPHIRLLEQFGYSVYVSHDPGGVGHGVLKLKPAAMIVNNRNPDNARQALEGLRQLQASGATSCPVVYVGDMDDTMVRLDAFRGGCSCFLPTAVSSMELAEAVDRLTGSVEGGNLRVLIVDNSRATTRYLASELRKANFDTECVNDPLSATMIMHAFDPELILMGLYMPGCNGEELAGIIRQDTRYDAIPIVYLSSEDDRQRQLDALRHGGDDFLVKPLKEGELVASISMRSSRFRRLRHKSERDSLTGLLNHAHMLDRIPSAMRWASTNDRPLSVCMIDIDHFKAVNDTHGHQIGDLVLKSLARLLRSHVVAPLSAGRVGGEEFMLLLPNTDADKAYIFVDAIRAEFSTVYQGPAGDNFRCTFSAGIATLGDHATAQDFRDAADEALYAAKRAGRNRSCNSVPLKQAA
ncbi:MAG: diguanylate cyclase (GGDEF)-like protein [Kiritimatiellia bacterium]|jgi:diguanylate cyclase (GGDEF)-like protein